MRIRDDGRHGGSVDERGRRRLLHGRPSEAQSTLRLRLRRAAFDPTKTLEGFDFSFNPKLNKAQLFDLATCQFIERHENALSFPLSLVVLLRRRLGGDP